MRLKQAVEFALQDSVAKIKDLADVVFYVELNNRRWYLKHSLTRELLELRTEVEELLHWEGIQQLKDDINMRDISILYLIEKYKIGHAKKVSNLENMVAPTTSNNQ